ncbi:hypothetical protein BDU57DRAFT_453314 [Ampelomyces quisqualis]|uniref:GMP synthase n=1 Tax=Ampelomyces quisqualis TaxID=50730 RepID=A0A6A5QG15_AMPQU|nr:hypothetical protein BDU57DRAFT_453314 [Ampelomyces quisqualis]
MADRFKSMAKGGWHQGQNRAQNHGGESGGRLGQVVCSHVEAAHNHQSAPLSSLTDPSTFAPPPKRLDYGANPTASRPTPGAPTNTTAAKPKPSLPPRLPPRQNSNPHEFAPAPPPTYNEAVQGSPAEGVLNQGALNRLGQAGVSVPGFGMGRTASPPVPPRQNAAAPTTGTSWADKQAALRTASGLRDDPSKVSGADMRNAASTASNFQQRHGAQVASGLKAANGLSQKYGIAGRVNNSAAASAGAVSPPPQSPTASGAGAAGKKPAPRPPPKKRELGGNPGEPPPIPLGSKPKF